MRNVCGNGRKCEMWQQKLLDDFYDEKPMNKGVEEHIAGCIECRDYMERLENLAVRLKLLETESGLFKLDVPVNEHDIHTAFRLAREISAKRNIKQNMWKETLLFLGAAVVLALLPQTALAGLGLKYILYVQLYLYLSIPVMLISVLRAKYINKKYEIFKEAF